METLEQVGRAKKRVALEAEQSLLERFMNNPQFDSMPYWFVQEVRNLHDEIRAKIYQLKREELGNDKDDFV